jgi:Flp pilus assembly protein TadG
MVMAANRKRQDRSERGQSLVEVAISLPIILLILLGTIDFGMALFTYVVLRDAAQEGALYGSLDPGNTAEIEIRARGISPHDPDTPAYSAIDLSNKDLVDVSIKMIGDNCQGLTNDVANEVRVSVSYDYPVLMPFSEQIIGSRIIPLEGTATNVILQPPCP